MGKHMKNIVKQGFTGALAVAISLLAMSDTSLGTYAEDSSLTSDKLQQIEKQADNAAAAINSTESDLAGLEQKQAELDEKIRSTEGDISAEQEHNDALNEQIQTVEQTMHKLAESVAQLQKDIDETEASIDVKQGEVDAKRKEIEDGIADFKLRMRAMYIAGNETYTDILVGASDFYDMLMKMELIKRVADHDNAEIDGLVELKEQFEAEQTELDLQKETLEDNLAELHERRKKQQAQMEKLEKLYAESEKSLGQLQSDKEHYEKNLDQINKEQEQFEADLMKLFEERQALENAKTDEQKKLEKEEQERKKKEAEEAAKKKAEEEAKKKAEEEAAKKAAEEEAKKKAEQEAAANQNNENQSGGDSSYTYNEREDDAPDFEVQDEGSDNATQTDTSGGTSSDTTTPSNPTSGPDANSYYGYTDKSRFTWPAPGFYHISYGVGWRWGAYHKGIDIWSEGIRGNNIIAADSGTVILVSNTCPHDYGKDYSCGCGGGYGNYCIIDHGDGWWTLYGHSEGITVTEGQYVNKGDVLGTIGSTGHSTGPHLHFEVRHNGEALNPEDYV